MIYIYKKIITEYGRKDEIKYKEDKTSGISG
jgi:hypothetical protein